MEERLKGTVTDLQFAKVFVSLSVLLASGKVFFFFPIPKHIIFYLI